MFDIKALRENFNETKAALSKRGKDFELEKFESLDKRRRELINETEQMKAKRNAASSQIPAMKKAGEDTTAIMAEMKELADAIKALDPQVRAIDEELETFLMAIPNIPHSSVPEGKDETDNVEIRKWGEPTQFAFEPKPHWDLGEALGILDPATAAKITGARFMLFRGAGARLERALINFMLDTHGKNGYEEIMPPVIAHRRSMEGVGQLPDKEGMLFHLSDTDYFLIPTAETPLTNIHREEILDGPKLPVKFCAYTPSFRKEAGAAGRDTRGLIRLHQFDKVEIFKLAHPNNSYEELETLTANAESILQALNLPYRVVNLCAGDLGFSNSKTYDLEVWMPSYNRYVEISSCSNYETFQARRAGLRFKENPTDKAAFAHTLNGSALAVGRAAAAIMENFQQTDGSIKIPPALVPYMGGLMEIK
ncbi:MAG: serine--tRNA ligase [Defluviitaleaceae bacterium]|nr:serine--tRNA ligase [Defluviitaleaceae bacterium]MCL2262977.1 serine--tRNA ligase [Defluviitaleaceae bacterium]